MLIINFLPKKFKNLTNRYLMFLLTIAVMISLTLVGIVNWNIWQVSHNFEQNILTDFKLQNLTSKIIYLDEVLTMSARMSATTGDLKWEDRYLQFVPQLDDTIKETIKLEPETYGKNATQTDEANLKLIDMETQAFELVKEQKLDQALAILFGQEYEQQKKIYAEGMTKTIEKIQNNIAQNIKSYSHELAESSVFSLVSFPILILSWLAILLLINFYIHQRNQAEKKINLAKVELQQSHDTLAISEQELRQKAEDLEKTLQELHQAQSQLVQNEKMTSLGQLVAGVAHEINNPVNFIHGNIPHLQSYTQDLISLLNLYQEHYPEPVTEIVDLKEDVDLEFLESDLQKILNSMRIGTIRIREIVLSLRNFSRMDEAEVKEVDLHEGIDSTLMILQHRLKSKPDSQGIKVVRNYGNLPLIECYAGQLNQVFMNILINAIDALEKMQIQQNQAIRFEPTIRISTDIINANLVQVSIQDNGEGIPLEIQSRIFEPFFTTKAIGKGTGMGMSISYQIIKEKHQGELTFNSLPNQGTEFLITIPIKQS